MEKKKTKQQKQNENSSTSSQKTKTQIIARGRVFKGLVTKKFPKRVVIEFERTVYISKFETFMKKKTRIHARLPDSMSQEINIGDLVLAQECRPLSKMIHFVVIKKIAEEHK